MLIIFVTNFILISCVYIIESFKYPFPCEVSPRFLKFKRNYLESSNFYFENDEIFNSAYNINNDEFTEDYEYNYDAEEDEEYDDELDDDDGFEESKMDLVLDEMKENLEAKSIVEETTREMVERKVQEIIISLKFDAKKIKWVHDRLEITIVSAANNSTLASPPVGPSVDELNIVHRAIYDAIDLDTQLASVLSDCEVRILNSNVLLL